MSRFTWSGQDFLECAPGWTLDARGRPVAPGGAPDGSAGDAHAPAVRVAPSASGSGRAAEPPVPPALALALAVRDPPPCSAAPGVAPAAPGGISAEDRWARALDLRRMGVGDDLVLRCVALTEAQRAAFLEVRDAAG